MIGNTRPPSPRSILLYFCFRAERGFDRSICHDELALAVILSPSHHEASKENTFSSHCLFDVDPLRACVA